MSQHVFDRRAVLRRLGAFAPLLALARARLIKPAAARTSARVVVIGAWVAGLAAARALQDSGAEVVVLEAKPHIGGRLVTDRSLGAPFEVGAGWIHGPNGNPVSALARQARATMFVTDDYNTALFDRDGTAVPMADLERLVGDYEALLHRVDDLDGSSDMALADAMRRIAPRALDDPRIQWAATAFTEFDTGGPIEALSAANFDEDDAFAGADVKDPETYGVYSYTGVGTTPRDFTRLAKPVGDRLLLAGEHTNFDYHGTVHGALISGRAAAERIVDLAG